MQNRRSIEVLWWNEGKLVTVVLCIEDFIDEFSVAKTQMLAASKELGLSTVNMLHLGKAGRAIGCTP